MSDPIQPWPVLGEGNRNHPVETLQYLLRSHGKAIDVDGEFGSRTAKAVRSFQKSEHLTADGAVGPKTWNALIELISEGFTGDPVRAVQEEFQFRNLSGDPAKGVQIDGLFGLDTLDAVIGFQQALGVDVDGLVGPVTWRALVSGMLSF